MKIAGVFVIVLAGLVVQAQQQPARAPTAPPPINWPAPALADGPIVLDTAIQHQVRLTVIKGFNQPWSMAFLPAGGGILVTERPGRLRIVRDGVLDPNPVSGTPQVQAQGLAGLMDIALHPRFNDNKFVYLTYHKPAAQNATPGNNAPVITLARGRWDARGLVDVHDIFSAIANNNASRIAFGRDGMICMSVGIGDPPVFWVPAITPSGLTFYTGDKFPAWKNNVFAGSLRQGEVPRSGHIDRLDFNEKWEELHRESFLRELQQRIRDIRQGPDGYLYALTAENTGALLRIEPFTP